MTYSDSFKIGFIQTIVEGSVAWGDEGQGYNRQMSTIAEEKAWYEIKKGFTDLMSGYGKPNFIIIPELSVPLGYEYQLRKLSAASGAIVVAGLDFVWTGNNLANKAIVVVPKNWPEEKKSLSTSFFYFGKTFYSQDEKDISTQLGGILISQPEIFILDAAEFGKIGIAICSDFFDVERFVVYKGRIHHLIIISHNKDTESYYFLAEAISRLVYCNVAICNTGEFGDSIGFCPYKESHQRIVYRHKGKGLFSTQVITFPVKDLEFEQVSTNGNRKFKSRPPGYEKYDW